jgi:hypothetical protein
MTRVLVVLSGAADQVADMLPRARARWPDARCTVLLRDSQRCAFAAHLGDAEVLLDKPTHGRLALVRALRQQPFDAGVVAWTGAFSYWPSKLMFVLARVRQREVFTERGTFAWSPLAVCHHLVWRAKAPVHATAGMPPGIPWPLALGLCAVRATLGRALAPAVTALRVLRRTRSSQS